MLDESLFNDADKEQREAAFADVAKVVSEYSEALREEGLPESLVHALTIEFHRVNILRDV